MTTAKICFVCKSQRKIHVPKPRQHYYSLRQSYIVSFNEYTKVYWRPKAVVPVLVLLFVALSFILRGDLF